MRAFVENSFKCNGKRDLLMIVQNSTEHSEFGLVRVDGNKVTDIRLNPLYDIIYQSSNYKLEDSHVQNSCWISMHKITLLPENNAEAVLFHLRRN